MKPLVLIAILTGLLGCTRDAPEQASKNGVLAVYSGGVVTATDLDRAILDLPPSLRKATETSEKDWRASLLRKIVLDRLIYEDAIALEVHRDKAFQSIDRHLRRDVFAREYLTTMMDTNPITNAALAEYFESNRQAYQHPERRHLFHIFRRYLPSESKAETLENMNAIRKRMIAGENLAALAKEVSHSESRHQGGDLGYVAKGKFSADFDRHVFALEKGIPSQPIATAEGFHLFLVQAILPAQDNDLTQVRAKVKQAYVKDLLRERRREFVENLPKPNPAFFPNTAELERLLNSQNPSILVLRVGDLEMPAITFQRLWQDRQRAELNQSNALSRWDLLQEIFDLERIYQHLLQKGEIDAQDPFYAKLRRTEIIEYFGRKKLRQLLRDDQAKLENHFENNRMRFATAPAMGLSRFTLPISNQPNEQMARLEALVVQIANGELTLQDAAPQLGGQYVDLGVLNLAQLQKVDLRAPYFVAGLKPGSVTPPYRFGNQLVILEITSRSEPQTQRLQKVKEKVIMDYLQHFSADLFDELSKKMLQDASFQIVSNTQRAP